MKRVLLNIIKGKGDCDLVNDEDCTHCPFLFTTTCLSSVNVVTSPEILQANYEVALKYYLERYGKDPDLLEVLI